MLEVEKEVRGERKRKIGKGKNELEVMKLQKTTKILARVFILKLRLLNKGYIDKRIIIVKK